MPGISIDTKPCFSAQTRFILSHSALQSDCLKFGQAPADRGIPRVQVTVHYLTQEFCFAAIPPFKRKSNSMIWNTHLKMSALFPTQSPCSGAGSITQGPRRAGGPCFTQRSADI